MRDGASARFGIGERTTISGNATPSESTSYIERSTARTSVYDIEESACGSRSISSVRWPRMARAAARLIAVVVFPTPPFWFAIAMTITAWRSYTVATGPPTTNRGWRDPRLHLVLAELL